MLYKYFQFFFEKLTIFRFVFVEVGKYAKVKISWHFCLSGIYVGIKMKLTGSLGNGGFLAPLPRQSSWNWIICEINWANDFAVGGSLWTCWKYQVKTNLESFEILIIYKQGMSFFHLQTDIKEKIICLSIFFLVTLWFDCKL